MLGCDIMRAWLLTMVGNAFFRFEIRQRRRRRINFRSPLRKAPSWGADNPSASAWEVFGDYWSFMSHINMAKVVDVDSNSAQWPEYKDLKSSLCFISLLLCPINLKMSRLGNLFIEYQHPPMLCARFSERGHTWGRLLSGQPVGALQR